MGGGVLIITLKVIFRALSRDEQEPCSTIYYFILSLPLPPQPQTVMAPLTQSTLLSPDVHFTTVTFMLV